MKEQHMRTRITEFLSQMTAFLKKYLHEIISQESFFPSKV